MQRTIGLRIMAWMMMLAPVAAPAQVITGTILGTVSDPSGAPVKSAKVRIVNTGTNVATETTANELGEYVAPYLPTGMYEVTIESTGFKKFRSTGITLTLDSKVRVDASLVLGAVQETVEVRADALALQTDSTDLNSTVSKNMIASVPNIGRSPTYYMATIPGVVPRGSFEGTGNFATGDGARAQFSNFTVNGSRPISTEVLLDGAPNTGAAFNEIITVPNLDAIGEMKVITNAYSAEYGRASGGVISFGTKSGTNEFHGAVYDYWRNSALNANDFGRNSFGRNAAGNPVREKGVFNIHQFGANLAGPVRLPKYDGRNKTFFFFAYEGNRRVEDASAFLTVPTQRERNGDFSQTFAQFRNPATGQIELTPRLIFNPTPGGSTVTEVAAGQFRINRAPFLGNVIPASMINATGRTLVSSYPLPNITPLNVDGTLNYFDSNVIRTQTDQFIFKLDQQFNERHRTFFRWTTDWTLNTPPDRFRGEGGNRAATQQSLTRQFIPTLTVGHTWTKSATSLFEFRMNVNRLSLINEPPQGVNTDLNALGFAPDMIRVLQNNPFPFVVPGGGFPEIGFRFFQLQRNFSTNSAFVVNYTKIRGKWTHKVGGEYRPMLNNFNQPRVPGMIFRADENWTRECTGPGCPALPPNRVEGYVLGDVMLGAMRGGDAGSQFAQNDPRGAFKNSYSGFYSQNDWKVTRSLTINLGVRYDLQMPMTERFNRLSPFDPTGRNFLGTSGAYLFAGREGASRFQMEPDYRQWQPRVGIAWRPLEKTVIRTGYGISFDQTTGVGSGLEGFGTDAFTAPAFSRIRPLNNLDILERPFNNSFNGGGTILADNANNPLLYGRSVVAITRNQRTPYIQQWNFTVERELPSGINLQVSYVGTKGTRLTIQQLPINGVNAMDPQILANARSTWIQTGVNPLNQLVANPLFGRIPAFNAAVGGAQVSRQQTLLPFPAFQNVTLFHQRFGNSNYHALQVNVRRAYRAGLEIGGNYTWSKSIDIGNHFSVNGAGNTANGGGGSTFTLRDWRLERSVSNSDVPHRAVIYYMYDLPFGKGKKWATSGVMNAVAGGWKIAGVTTFSSGLPLAIAGGGFGRPDLIADPVLPRQYRVFGDGRTPVSLPDGTSVVVPNRRLLVFNPNAFRNRVVSTANPSVPGATILQNDQYWYGTAPRFLDDLRSFGINNWNLTLSKTIPMGERWRAELRAEAVNAFNRTEFGAGGIDRNFGAANLNPNQGVLGSSTNANFGTADITAIGRTPRYLQMVLRIQF